MPIGKGTLLGPYEILEPAGAGGMGVVYKARDTRLDRIVAIKLLPEEKVADPERKRRFLQEAKAASALNHPNIVTVYDVAAVEGCEFIVMEYVDGRTLSDMIPVRGLRLVEVLRIAIQAADALATAHSAGIVHRDLKPANIMVTQKGQVKVLDFGLAKLMPPGPTNELDVTVTTGGTRHVRTDEGVIVGSAPYMSPEQAEGRPVDARSDIFSFGAVLYEMITGQRAFRGDSKISTLAAILQTEPRPMSELASAPADLDRIVMRCLRKDIERRSQHMSDVKLALEDLREDSESGRLAPAAVQPARRRWLWPAVASSALVIAAVAIGWAILRNREASHPELVRLSPDDGYQYGRAAISPDGKFVAYRSDRTGSQQIWLQQVGGEEPIQLTHAGESSGPDWSPDGTKMVYSSHQGGNFELQIIPLLGGAPRRIALGNPWAPRFSPDGKEIAFWNFGEGLSVVSALADEPRVVIGRTPRPDLLENPCWIDPAHLLAALPSGENAADFDWYVIPVQGGGPIPTGAAQVLRGAGFDPSPPGVLFRDRVLFSGKKEGLANIWGVHLQRNPWRVSGPPVQLTFGTDTAAVNSISTSGTAAVNISHASSDLYFLPMDVAEGKITGPPIRLTKDPRPKWSVAVEFSAFFLFRTSGGWILKELDSGKEIPLSYSESFAPIVSADGREAFYGRREGGSISVISRRIDIPPREQSERTLCSRCGIPVGITPDSQFLLLDSESGRGGGAIKHSALLLERSTGKTQVWLELPTRSISFSGSPFFLGEKANWVILDDIAPGQHSRRFAVPWRNPVPPESEWIELRTDGRFTEPSNLEYFFERNQLMATRFDQRGSIPFPVKQASDAQPALAARDAWDIGPRGIIFAHLEFRGSVWLLKLPD